jgi:hypothetical protein
MFSVDTRLPKLAKKPPVNSKGRLLSLSSTSVFLFNEDITKRPHLDPSSQIVQKLNQESLKTAKDLRNSILGFRYDPEDEEKLESIQVETHRSNEDLAREKTIEAFGAIKDNSLVDDRDKIRPGHTAKRYLSNWTKYWQPELVVNLAKNGHLIESNLFEPHKTKPNDKQRINDDISRTPLPYRFKKEWEASNQFLSDFGEIIYNIKSMRIHFVTIRNYSCFYFLFITLEEKGVGLILRVNR